MKVPKSTQKAAEEQVAKQRMFIPTIKHAYALSITSENYPTVFQENAKIGEVWFNGLKKVADKDESFVVVPISYRGRVKYKNEEGEKKTHLNPCFDGDINPTGDYDQFDDCPVEPTHKNIGADILVYIPKIEEFAVIVFQPSAMEDFTNILRHAESPSIELSTKVTKFKSKDSGMVTFYRFDSKPSKEKVKVPDATVANETYQMLNME